MERLALLIRPKPVRTQQTVGCAVLVAALGMGLSSCAEHGVRLQVEMGHCFVEPVTFDGERWNVPLDEQFGSGGLSPKNWEGSGVMTRVGVDRAQFEDDGGSTLMFFPADDPSVRAVETMLCE